MALPGEPERVFQCDSLLACAGERDPFDAATTCTAGCTASGVHEEPLACAHGRMDDESDEMFGKMLTRIVKSGND